jgi:hypothetical protein
MTNRLSRVPGHGTDNGTPHSVDRIPETVFDHPQRTRIAPHSENDAERSHGICRRSIDRDQLSSQLVDTLGVEISVQDGECIRSGDTERDNGKCDRRIGYTHWRRRCCIWRGLAENGEVRAVGCEDELMRWVQDDLAAAVRGRCRHRVNGEQVGRVCTVDAIVDDDLQLPWKDVLGGIPHTSDTCQHPARSQIREEHEKKHRNAYSDQFVGRRSRI